jgi:integrase
LGRERSAAGLRARNEGLLTLAEGIELAFEVSTGMYSARTKHAHESRRLAERGADILGRTLCWSELTPGKIQLLVRVLARRSVDGRGMRTAEYMCDVLYAIANWLREEDLIPDRAARPRKNWKARLREDWEALTGTGPSVHRPRYSIPETAALFRALPSADPRLALLLDLAAELRVGQALRARRSDLILDDGGGLGKGQFVVHGRIKKPGETVDLHPELRERVDAALASGYLATVETAYCAHAIKDYYLFPSGRLKQGSATVEQCTNRPLGLTAIRKMFQALEASAGVQHRPGRGFYGIRRTATDLAPEFTSDSRVLNRLTGHLNSETRERIYQDRAHELVRAKAAIVRREMRQYLEAEGHSIAEEDRPHPPAPPQLERS